MVRIALIEDHDLTRLGLKMIFQQHPDVEVVGEAEDGITGLKLLQTSQADVAVVDLGLPGLDGIEVTRRFKQSFGETATQAKVMILTMQGNEDAVLAAFAAGADSYCMKDQPAERLIEALQSTHRCHNWIDPTIAQIVLRHYCQRQELLTDSTSGSKTINILASSEQKQVLQTYPLTHRELEILTLIVKGYSNAQVASECFITVGTVKTHVRNILNKLCVDDRTQAVVRALRSGLVA